MNRVHALPSFASTLQTDSSFYPSQRKKFFDGLPEWQMVAGFLRGLTLTYIICIGDVFVTDRCSCNGALDKAILTGYWVTPLHRMW